MERIKALNRYPKGILLLLIVMVSIFTIVYFIAFSKVGFVYHDAFLEKRSDGGDTVYTGHVNGRKLSYTVTEENAVICRYGSKTYGPYTVQKDPSAVPKSNGRAEDMVGVEIREGESILFRGGVLTIEDQMVLVDEKTGDPTYDITVSGDGVMYDSEGNVIEPMKPSAYTILHLLDGPELIKGGNFWAWLGGILFAGMTAVSILFAEELFHFRMSFRVRYAELTEPTEWEMITRYAGWTLGIVATLIIFFSGLNILR